MQRGQQGRMLLVEEPAAELGQVTLSGKTAGVVVGGERRQVAVYGPGGYAWRPAAGDRVLVIKAGAERESPCLVGTLQSGADLGPGEVRLSGEESALWLKQAVVVLEGEVTVNGTKLTDLIASIVWEIVASLG